MKLESKRNFIWLKKKPTKNIIPNEEILIYFLRVWEQGKDAH